MQMMMMRSRWRWKRKHGLVRVVLRTRRLPGRGEKNRRDGGRSGRRWGSKATPDGSSKHKCRGSQQVPGTGGGRDGEGTGRHFYLFILCYITYMINIYDIE